LTAAWVALEDIDPTATRFFVVPGSQDFERDFSEDITRYMEAMKSVSVRVADSGHWGRVA